MNRYIFVAGIILIVLGIAAWAAQSITDSDPNKNKYQDKA